MDAWTAAGYVCSAGQVGMPACISKAAVRNAGRAVTDAIKQHAALIQSSHNATGGFVMGVTTCLFVCHSIGVIYDNTGQWREIEAEGLGLKVDAGGFFGYVSGPKSYVNGLSTSDSCDVETGGGGWLEAGNGDGGILPTGGGGGVALGLGGGCAVMQSYTSDAPGYH